MAQHIGSPRVRRLVALIPVALVGLLVAAAPGISSPAAAEAIAAGPTPVDLGIEALAETDDISLATLVGAFGCDKTAKLKYSGFVQDDGDWRKHVSGTYAGQPVELDLHGDFDPATGHYDVGGAGSVGPLPFSLTGVQDFAEPSLDVIWMGNGFARVGDRLFDWHFIKDLYFKRGRWIDEGLFVLTNGHGRPLQKYRQKSIYVPGTRKHRFVKVRLVPVGCQIIIEGAGTDVPGGVSVDGTETLA